jgi:hypothetical protein
MELRRKRKQQGLSSLSEEWEIIESVPGRSPSQNKASVRFKPDTQPQGLIPSATMDSLLNRDVVNYALPEEPLKVDPDIKGDINLDVDLEGDDLPVPLPRPSPGATPGRLPTVNCTFGSFPWRDEHELSFISVDFHPLETGSFLTKLDAVASKSFGLLFL